MNDGIKIEYTEGIMTASLHIRTNCIDYDTNYEIQKFVDYAKTAFQRQDDDKVFDDDKTQSLGDDWKQTNGPIKNPLKAELP